jgi:hypothetical protein
MIILNDNDRDISVTMFLYDNSDRRGDIDNDSECDIGGIIHSENK